MASRSFDFATEQANLGGEDVAGWNIAALPEVLTEPIVRQKLMGKLHEIGQKLRFFLR